MTGYDNTRGLRDLEMVARAHGLEPSTVSSSVDLNGMKDEFDAFEVSARRLLELQLNNWPDALDEDSLGLNQENQPSERQPLHSEGSYHQAMALDCDMFDNRASSLAGTYVRSRIEAELIRSEVVSPVDAAFQEEAFAQLVETALLKATDQQHVVRQITEPMAEEIVGRFDNSTPLIKALEYIQYLSNNFLVDPSSEIYSSGERLLWGMKDEAARDFANITPEELFRKDLRAFLCHVVVEDSFRREERSRLEQSCFDADEWVDSEEYNAFKKECESQIEGIIDKLCPIFENRIENGRFADLKGAATEIERLGPNASLLIAESILGYDAVERDGGKFFQPGIGECTLNSQLYDQVQPYQQSNGYRHDFEERPSDQVTRYRLDLVGRMRSACQKVDPDFESNPKFAGAMRAFGVIAELVVPPEQRDALRAYAAEIERIRAAGGEAAAMQQIETDIAKASGRE